MPEAGFMQDLHRLLLAVGNPALPEFRSGLRGRPSENLRHPHGSLTKSALDFAVEEGPVIWIRGRVQGVGVEDQPGIFELDALESSLLTLGALDAAEELPGSWTGRSENKLVHVHHPAVNDPQNKTSMRIPRDMPTTALVSTCIVEYCSTMRLKASAMPCFST